MLIKMTFPKGFNKLLIDSIRPYDYMYQKDTSAEILQLRNTFWKLFVEEYNKENPDNKITESAVRGRWKKLRENYVAADLLKEKNESLNLNHQQILTDCSFLKDHIKHNSLKLSTNGKQNTHKPAEESFEDEQEILDTDEILEVEIDCTLNEQDKKNVDEDEEDSSEDDSDNDAAYRWFNNKPKNVASTINHDGAQNSMEDPMTNALANQLELDELCQQAAQETSKGKGKRATAANIEADFPKKQKICYVKDSDALKDSIQSITLKINDLVGKKEDLLKARARAVLICSYLNEIKNPVERLRCTKAVLNILKKYAKQKA